MSAPIINVAYTQNIFKSSKCKECSDKLVLGCKVLSVRRANKFVTTHNYCLKCAESALVSMLDELTPLMKEIIELQEEISNANNKMRLVEESYKEAVERFPTTLEMLGK